MCVSKLACSGGKHMCIVVETMHVHGVHLCLRLNLSILVDSILAPLVEGVLC